MPNAKYLALAEATANALGKDFVIGVRGYGRGWFAHCAGIEFDGGTPEMAVRQVVDALQTQARADVSQARNTLEAAIQRSGALENNDA